MSVTGSRRARACGRVGQVRVDVRSDFGGAGLGEPAPVDEAWLGVLADRSGLALPDAAAGLVLALDPRVLSQEGRLAAIAVAERAIAALAAAQAALVAEVARAERADAGPAVDCPEQELLAVALGVSPVTAGARSHHAVSLCERLPAVWSAQRSGRIWASAARAICEETEALTVEQARGVADALLAWAPGVAPGLVRRRARGLAARADTRAHADRHRQAHARRRVVVQADGDGMASLWWTDDAATIARARDLIDHHARATIAAGSIGGVDAARCDALAALLLRGGGDGEPGAAPPGRRPVVAVHVSLPALLGADDAPGEVPGLGHVPADVARRVAADSDWQLFLHSADGQLAAVATRAYTPTPAMAALVVARDRTCRFPGCAAPAHRCDLDHRVPYDHHDPDAGGPTHPDNLQALCRRHHNLKTTGTWTVLQHPDGTLHWTGPHGTRAHVQPDHPDPPW